MEENKFTFSKYGLDVRLVNINDAEFILKLRSQKKSITFLNTTSNSIINQIDWIRDYKIREKHQKEFLRNKHLLVYFSFFELKD